MLELWPRMVYGIAQEFHGFSDFNERVTGEELMAHKPYDVVRAIFRKKVIYRDFKQILLSVPMIVKLTNDSIPSSAGQTADHHPFKHFPACKRRSATLLAPWSMSGVLLRGLYVPCRARLFTV